MTATELIGYAAATLTTVSFIPQAIKSIRGHDTKSLSVGMYVIFTLGVVLWGVYGWFRRDPVIIGANAITGFLAITILVIKLRNDVFGASPRIGRSD